MMSPWLAGLIFFSILGLLFASQLFWLWRARRFLRARRHAWQRWLLGVPLYACLFGLLGMLLLLPVRWWLALDAPVLVSLFAFFRQPAVMVPVGLWMAASMFSFLLIVLVQGCFWVYCATMESQKQATLGKLALGIRVTDLQGGRISFARATARHFAKLLALLPVGIGFFMVTFTDRKQGLHDLMAQCLVLTR